MGFAKYQLKKLMIRSNTLYLSIVVLAFISFVGYVALQDVSALNPVWYFSAALGIILFIIRIIRGDD